MLRLRQSCCHLSLLHSVIDDEELESLQSEYENKEDLPVNSESKNQYELEEVESMAVSTTQQPTAEKSSSKNSKFQSIAAVANDKDLSECFEDSFMSSKFFILLEMLDQVMVSQPGDKIIIVSQWTSVLNKISNNLYERGIAFDFIHGKVIFEERHRIVESFNNPTNSSCRVMLLSLGCGGGNVMFIDLFARLMSSILTCFN
jgi:SNF2 family DNA or RNA helicase